MTKPACICCNHQLEEVGCDCPAELNTPGAELDRRDAAGIYIHTRDHKRPQPWLDDEDIAF